MTDKVRLPATWQHPDGLRVTPGRVDQAARFAFRNGHCHSLAFALQRACGWPLVWLGTDTCLAHEAGMGSSCSAYRYETVCGCQITHVAVQAPNGEIVDIDGPASPEDLWERVSEDVFRVDRLSDAFADRCMSDPDWAAPAVDIAAAFVPAVLEVCEREWASYPGLVAAPLPWSRPVVSW